MACFQWPTLAASSTCLWFLEFTTVHSIVYTLLGIVYGRRPVITAGMFSTTHCLSKVLCHSPIIGYADDITSIEEN